jgi:hypothetical protein
MCLRGLAAARRVEDTLGPHQRRAGAPGGVGPRDHDRHPERVGGLVVLEIGRVDGDRVADPADHHAPAVRLQRNDRPESAVGRDPLTAVAVGRPAAAGDGRVGGAGQVVGRQAGLQGVEGQRPDLLHGPVGEPRRPLALACHGDIGAHDRRRVGEQHQGNQDDAAGHHQLDQGEPVFLAQAASSGAAANAHQHAVLRLPRGCLGPGSTCTPLRGSIGRFAPYWRTASPSQRVNAVVLDSKLAHSELISTAR